MSHTMGKAATASIVAASLIRSSILEKQTDLARPTVRAPFGRHRWRCCGLHAHRPIECARVGERFDRLHGRGAEIMGRIQRRLKLWARLSRPGRDAEIFGAPNLREYSLADRCSGTRFESGTALTVSQAGMTIAGQVSVAS